MSLSTTSKHFLNTCGDSNTTTSLGSPFQHLLSLSEKNGFLITNPTSPLAVPHAIPSSPVSSYMEEEADTHLAPTSFQVGLA